MCLMESTKKLKALLCETCKENPVWADSSAHYYDKQTPIYYADECLSCLVKSQKERFRVRPATGSKY